MGIQQKIDRKLKELDNLFEDEEVELEPIAWLPFKGKPQEFAYYSPAQDLLYGGEPGGGKATSLNVIIPTVCKGYSTMGKIQVGDIVFGQNGKPCNVIATSPVMHGRKVFDVIFDDDSVVRVDGDHEWHTFTRADRQALLKNTDEYREKRRLNRASRGTGKRLDLVELNQSKALGYMSKPILGSTRTTTEIRDTLRVGSDNRINHAIAVAASLDLPEQDLPISPYVLGFWLGDGNSDCGRVTIGSYVENALVLLRSEGYEVRHIPSCKYGYNVFGLRKQLRLDGLLKNKHIPESYFFASFEQRIALLQGLMDTDGTACKGGQCVFYNSKKSLINDASRLLHTLGIKHTIRSKKPPKNTEYLESYSIKFVASFPAFRLDDKLVRQNMDLRATQKWRYIVDVVPVESEPVKCIEVDSSDHLYLVGEACIPTHNSDLIAGLALTAHKRSLILRREASQLNEIVSRIEDQLCDGLYRFHGKTHILKYGDRWVEKGGCKLIKDKVKYKGRPHDLKAYDELSEIPKEIYDYTKVWNRTNDPSQRCRTVATTNPPDTQEGQWIISSWAPWLDKRHPNPAQSGEIRWYVGDEEVEAGTLYARSKTFIYSSITDNSVLMATGYQDTLNSLPEELRRTMMEGFTVGMQDTPYQVIPTSWVEDAIKRGRLLEPKSLLEPIDAIACDPSRGGKDACAIAIRRGVNIQTKEYPAISAQDGMQVVQYIIEARQGQNPLTMIDVIGIGSSPYDIAKLQGLQPIAMNASEKSLKRDRSAKLSFANKRAEWWWKFREALDPNYDPQITLPDNPKLLAELTAPLWSLTMRGILIESKDEIKKRLGRSTNLGDAIVMVADVPSVYTSSFI